MTEDVQDDAPAEPVMDPGTDPSGRGEASRAWDPEGVARDGHANADLEPEAATPAEPDRAEPVPPGRKLSPSAVSIETYVPSICCLKTFILI